MADFELVFVWVMSNMTMMNMIIYSIANTKSNIASILIMKLGVVVQVKKVHPGVLDGTLHQCVG